MVDFISERAKVSRDWEGFFHETLSICYSNQFHAKDNISGNINLGIPENNICDHLLRRKLNVLWECDFNSLGYQEGHGTIKLRNTMARFMTEFLESHRPVSADDLFCMNGITSCIDVLGHCLADPGEVFLAPTPMYARTHANFMQRSLIELWPIHLIAENSENCNIGLTMEKIIDAYKSALKAGMKVRGIFLINPNNPLGDIYSPELLMNILTFCKANSLHVVVDEVCALSVFSEKVKFHSILKFPSIPDPDRTHVIYGLSKDLGIAGLKVGVIYTKCKQLQRSLMQLSYFNSIPYPFVKIVTDILSDLEWCRSYVKYYKICLALNYEICMLHLKNAGVKVRECPAGLFIWVDFRHLCGKSFKREEKLCHDFLEKFQVYIAPGEQFFCAQPGWFRIVFAQNLLQLKIGLGRLIRALKSLKE